MDDGGDAVWVAPFLRGDNSGKYGSDNELGGGVLSACNMWCIWWIYSDLDSNKKLLSRCYASYKCFVEIISIM